LSDQSIKDIIKRLASGSKDEEIESIICDKCKAELPPFKEFIRIHLDEVHQSKSGSFSIINKNGEKYALII